MRENAAICGKIGKYKEETVNSSGITEPEEKSSGFFVLQLRRAFVKIIVSFPGLCDPASHPFTRYGQ
jgi:hypothetical protein